MELCASLTHVSGEAHGSVIHHVRHAARRVAGRGAALHRVPAEPDDINTHGNT